MANLFLTGASLVVSLTNVTVLGTLVPTLGAGDTLTCTLYHPAGTAVLGPLTATGDGQGNYQVTFAAPATPGLYYLQWDSVIQGQVGKEVVGIELRDRL